MPIKNPTITKEQAKEELIKVSIQLGRTPYKKEFYKYRTLIGCHDKAIEKLFGPNAWNNYLIFSGFEVNIKSPQKPKIVKCLHCKKEFKKSYFETQKTKNHFCSKSCSASYNNKIQKLKHGNNKSEKFCENCNKIHSRNSNFCSNKCKIELFMKNKTIKESLTKGERQQKYSNIRSIARNYSKYLSNKNSCQNCGYNKHVEIAHIISISSFNENDLLINVNNENNLLALCPNCHWEFDNNLITLEQIIIKQ